MLKQLLSLIIILTFTAESAGIDFLCQTESAALRPMAFKVSPTEFNEDPKFHSNGEFKAFYGLTTIAKVKEETELNGRIDSVQETLKNAIIRILKEEGVIKKDNEVMHYVRFLQKDSFHMTVCDIDPSEEFNSARQPFIPVTTGQFSQRLAQLNAAFNEIGSNCAISGQVKGVLIKDVSKLVKRQATVIGVRVQFSEAELAKINRIRGLIEKHTKSAVRAFPGHITLAYLIKSPGDRALRRIQAIIDEHQNDFIGDFIINNFDMTYFANMALFTSVLTKDLQNGQVYDHRIDFERLSSVDTRTGFPLKGSSAGDSPAPAPPAAKTSSAGGSSAISPSAAKIPIETIYKDGKMNIFLLEKLLSDTATDILRKKTGSDNVDARILFFGSCKYLCDDEGWLANRGANDIDVFIIYSSKIAGVDYLDIAAEAFSQVCNRIIDPEHQRDILKTLLYDAWQNMGEASTTDYATVSKILDTIYGIAKVFRVSKLKIILGTDHYNYMTQDIAKRYLQLLYYFGDRETYRAYRDRFFKLYNNGNTPYGKWVIFLMRIARDPTTKDLIKRLNKSSPDESLLAKFKQNVPWIEKGVTADHMLPPGTSPFRWPEKPPRYLAQLTWDDEYELGLYFQGIPAIAGVRMRFNRRPDAQTLKRLAYEQKKVSPVDYYWTITSAGESFAEPFARFIAFKKEFEKGDNIGSLWFLYPAQLQEIGDFAAQLLKQDPRHTITILDYGTSNGEEALSIAVYLDSRFKDEYPNAKFRVIGKDIVKPEPENMNLAYDRDATEIPKVVKARYDSYFVPIGTWGHAAPKPEVLNLAELSQGDINNIAQDNAGLIGQVDMLIVNGVCGRTAKLPQILEDVQRCLSPQGRIFISNKYSHVKGSGFDFENVIADLVKKGKYRKINDEVFEKSIAASSSSAAKTSSAGGSSDSRTDFPLKSSSAGSSPVSSPSTLGSTMSLEEFRKKYPVIDYSIKIELPMIIRSLEEILALRKQLDESGDQDRPIIIWQNLRLGEMYPFFNDDMINAMGILEVDNVKRALKQKAEDFQKTRFILIRAKKPSTLNKDAAEETSLEDNIERLSKKLRATVLMIDSSKSDLSNAQKRVKIKYGKQNWIFLNPSELVNPGLVSGFDKNDEIFLRNGMAAREPVVINGYPSNVLAVARLLVQEAVAGEAIKRISPLTRTGTKNLHRRLQFEQAISQSA